MEPRQRLTRQRRRRVQRGRLQKVIYVSMYVCNRSGRFERAPLTLPNRRLRLENSVGPIWLNVSLLSLFLIMSKWSLRLPYGVGVVYASLFSLSLSLMSSLLSSSLLLLLLLLFEHVVVSPTMFKHKSIDDLVHFCLKKVAISSPRTENYFFNRWRTNAV